MSNEARTNQKWIKAAEVAERMGGQEAGFRASRIGRWASVGKLTKKENGTYPWPQVKEEIELILNPEGPNQENATKITQAQNLNIKKEETSDISATEQVMKLLEEGHQQAPDRAYQWARAMNELIKAQKEQLKLLDMQGRTIDRDEAYNIMFTASRQNRDIWLNWPQIVATEMAEELGLDRKLIHDVLRKFVRKNLDRIATIPIEDPASDN